MNRIAVGGILTECNHFGGLPIDLATYEAAGLLRGDSLLQQTTSVVGGMMHGLREWGVAVAPLLYASACSGGPVTRPCYDQLRGELLQRLQDAMPVDGVLLPLHGSALVDGLDDPEGDLITATRDLVGAEVPIVVTLDLHAHVTAAMVRHADAMLAWETYPHRDQFTTGQRAARLLRDILDGKCRPTMAMGKAPVITSAIHGSTEGDDPFARLMRQTKALEQRKEVLSTSLFLIHPYMDCEQMGSGALVVTDNDLELARELAGNLARAYWDLRHELEPQTWQPRDAIRAGMEIEGGPVLLVETADCCGGGAAGDSIASLVALLEVTGQRGGDESAVLGMVPVVDPAAAEACHRAGVGAELSLKIGHQLDPRWGQPQEFRGVVERLSEGQFTYQGGQWEGQLAQMGATAVFRIGNTNRSSREPPAAELRSVLVLLMSRATYDWADEQWRAVNLKPADTKFLVVKNPMNYRVAYQSISQGVFVLDTPGPTPATVKHINFQKLKRPFFPADSEITDWEPVILES